MLFRCILELSDGVAIAEALTQIAPEFYTTTWNSKIKTDVGHNWRLKVSNLKKILEGVVGKKVFIYIQKNIYTYTLVGMWMNLLSMLNLISNYLSRIVEQSSLVFNYASSRFIPAAGLLKKALAELVRRKLW